MLPFVRGVDLSGNDFKVSRPGVGPTSLQAASSARARAGLHFLSRQPPGPAPPRTADGSGCGSSRRSRPWREQTPVAPLRGRTGKPGPARTGRSHAREWAELVAPTPVSQSRGLGPTRAGEWPGGLRASAPASAALRPRPSEVTRPGQALTHGRLCYRADGGGSEAHSSPPRPCHRHSILCGLGQVTSLLRAWVFSSGEGAIK